MGVFARCTAVGNPGLDDMTRAIFSCKKTPKSTSWSMRRGDLRVDARRAARAQVGNAGERQLSSSKPIEARGDSPPVELDRARNRGDDRTARSWCPMTANRRPPDPARTHR